MKKIFSILMMLIVTAGLTAQQMKPEETEDWSRQPPVVRPGNPGEPPSDAIILYRGPRDAVNWVHENLESIKWIADSALTVSPRTGGIKTVRSFGDCQLHIEWRSPAEVKGTGQGRGNSGVFLMGKYELQVLDSYNNETYYNGQAGSLYKQHIPLVNASKKPGEWQSFDVIFTAPRFNPEGQVVSPAYITVFHNGVLIQNHARLRGPTEYIGIPQYKAHADKLPLSLQDHSNPVSFRNIWIREL
jgi:hypothetical protein